MFQMIGSSNNSKMRYKSAPSRHEIHSAEGSLRELNAEGNTGDPIQRLRLLCLSKGADGILGLGRSFRRLDEDGHRQLSREEFLQGLEDTGVELTDEEAAAIFDKFDEDHNGRVNVTEFLQEVRPPMSDSRKNIVNAAFTKTDKTGEGIISLAELKRAYNVKANPKYLAGEETEDEIRKKFLHNFENDATKNGMITHEEFMNYYSALSAWTENDCYFDLMMRQFYKL